MSSPEPQQSEQQGWIVVRPDPPNDVEVHVVPLFASQPRHELTAKCWCDPERERFVEDGSDPLYVHRWVQ